MREAERQVVFVVDRRTGQTAEDAAAPEDQVGCVNRQRLGGCPDNDQTSAGPQSGDQPCHRRSARRRRDDGGGTAEAIDGRKAQLRSEIEASDSDWDREKLEERLAKLAGGVAVIKVGAATETDLKKRKEAVEDAVAAAKAAVEEGIVTGGGAALVQARTALDGLRGSLTGDELIGLEVFSSALSAPLYWIATNAGLDGPVVVNKVSELPAGHGFNAATLTYGDLLADGVVDPAKVTRSAVLNAASVARMILTTETAVVDKPAEEADHGHGHHGHAH